MDGTKFTMTMGKKKHVTDSRRNPMFATFQAVLEAVINGRPIPAGDDLTISKNGGVETITITPTGKKRQMFTSFCSGCRHQDLFLQDPAYERQEWRLYGIYV